MMEINQFAIYQLKEVAENREIRFRSYKTLQESNMQIRYENYEQKYLGRMLPEDTPGSIIDGRVNNLPSKPRKIGKRISVLDRLHLKQAEIAKRGGKSAPQMAVAEDMERRRK